MLQHCLFSGTKGQRKVMFTCIKRNLVNKELKVAQLAGSVAEQSAYHHGEVSAAYLSLNAGPIETAMT